MKAAVRAVHRRARKLPALTPLCVSTRGSFWISAFQRDQLQLEAVERLQLDILGNEALFFGLSTAAFTLREKVSYEATVIREEGDLLRLDCVMRGLG